MQFGSWKTVSVSKLTESDLAEREEEYEKALMRSSKQKKTKGKQKQQKQQMQAEQEKQPQKTVELEDEDEQDAFDTYNPFGGTYKQFILSRFICRGVDLSGSDPVYRPERREIQLQSKEPEKESKSEPLEAVEPTPPVAKTTEVAQPFISTPISFSFQPTQHKSEKPREQPKSSTLSSFFS